MSLSLALLLYLLLFLLLFFLSRYYHITPWSSFILASLVSIIFLSFIYPVSLTTRLLNKDPLLIVYTLLQLSTIFLLLLYILSNIFKDRVPIPSPTLPFSPSFSYFSPSFSPPSSSFSPFSPSSSPYFS